jgi:hypothetical protein
MNLERNYKGTREKILSEEVLGKEDLRIVLNIGLDFISEEIKKNNLDISVQLERKSKDVQEYLPYITLVRLIDKYKELENEIRKAAENNDTSKINRFSETKTVKLFGELKGYYIQKLNMPGKEKGDFNFDDKLIDTICCTPGFFDEEKYLDKNKWR